MKRYIIFAGVNGAGKSSLYLDELTHEINLDLGVRINADEIQVREAKEIIEGGKAAVDMLKKCLSEDRTFNQETTFSGLKNVKHVKEAKEKGFYVSMRYVGLDSKELAVKRVASRVIRGGHDVPKALIESRYDKSLKNLKCVIDIVDELEIYDNSVINKLIYYKKDGVEVYKTNDMPKWAKELFDE